MVLRGIAGWSITLQESVGTPELAEKEEEKKVENLVSQVCVCGSVDKLRVPC